MSKATVAFLLGKPIPSLHDFAKSVLDGLIDSELVMDWANGIFLFKFTSDDVDRIVLTTTEFGELEYDEAIVVVKGRIRDLYMKDRGFNEESY